MTPKAPVLSRLSLTPSTLRRARGRKKGTTGTLRFTLSAAARVTVSVQRPTRGHRKGTTCSAKARKGPRCTRYVAVGSIHVTGRAGANRVRLTARFAHRTLAAGRYRLVLVAVDGSGRRSTPAASAFRVH